MIIASMDELEKEALEIQGYLEITVSDDPQEVVLRGNDLAVYISRSGKMLADAKVHLDRQMKSSIMKQLKEIGTGAGLPATTMNNLIHASCERENYVVSWIERMNRAATHQLDWCRTLVSKSKEEMRLSSGISNE
jgi:hypothetical protein